MTTDEKIDLLITSLTEKASKFYWCKTKDGWFSITSRSRYYATSIVTPPEFGYKFVVCQNTIVRVLTALDDELIPTEDLNTIQNQALRTKLTSLVAKLYQDRSELIEDLLDQLKRL